MLYDTTCMTAPAQGQEPAKSEPTASQTSGQQNAGEPQKAAGTATSTTKNQASEPDTSAASVKTFTEEELNRRLEKERRAWEKQIKEAEEKARLSEAERLQREADELRQQIRLRDARDLFFSELGKLGAKSPQLLFAAVERQVEFDDKGGVKNLAELIADLKAEYPEQFGQEKPNVKKIDAGAAGDPNASGLTIEKLKTLSPQEIKLLPWDQVRRAMEEAAKSGN